MYRDQTDECSNTDGPVTVISIVGAPRSGSTIVARLLGETSGVFCLGEVMQLWTGLLTNVDKACGCGLRIRECPFWAEVFNRIGFDGTSRSTQERAAMQNLAIRRTHPWLGLPRLLRVGHRQLPANARPFAEALIALYEAAAATAGCRILVDSSKKSDYCALVSRLPGIRSYTVHTLRDPRGVLMSHYARRFPDTSNASHLHEALRVGTAWEAETLAALMLVRLRPHGTRVEYARFAQNPQSELGSLLDAVGGDASTLPFSSAATAILGTTHTVGGSPTRFDQGEVTVKPDQRWREVLNYRDRRLMEAFALTVRPLGVRFE